MRGLMWCGLLASACGVAPGEVPVIDPPEPTRGPGCAEAGFDAVPFDFDAKGVAIGDPVPDATFDTLQGRFTLSEAWGDCHQFTLVPVIPSFERDDLLDLIEDSTPYNTYLFYAYGDDAEAQVTALAEAVDETFRRKSPKLRDTWRPRFRFGCGT